MHRCRRFLSFAATALFAALLLGEPPVVRADNEIPTAPGVSPEAPQNPNENRPCTDDPSEGPGGATDPIYLDTGEFFLNNEHLTTPDLVLPVRGMTLNLRRSYRSNHAYNGVLGYGWDFRMNRRLRQLDTGNLLLTTGTCRRDEFSFNGSGWDAPPGVFATLVQNPDGSYTETFPSGITHTFDANGNLIETRDRHGNRIALEYSAQKMPIQGRSEFFVDSETRVVAMEHRLEKIIDPTNREVTFGYHTDNGRIATITDWTGRVWQYDYDDFGNLIKVTSPPIADYPQGTFTTYHYDDARFPHKITKVIPPNGQATQTARVQNIYDDEGRVIQQNLGNGSTVTVAYDPENQTTTVTDGTGTEWIYTFDDGQISSRAVVTRGVRPSSIEPAGTIYTTTYEYNGDSQRTRTVQPEGNAIERVYDSANSNVLARGNLLEVRRFPKPGSGEPPIVATFTYKTPFQQIGTVADPNGNVTEYFYDASHDLERIQYPTVPEGTPQELYGFNSFGQLAFSTDANGNTTTYGYDVNGYLDTVTRASGTALAATSELAPDALGRPTVLRDANGHTTQLSFNAWNSLEQRTAPAPFGYVADFHYDESGNLIRREEQSEIPGDPQTTTWTYNVRDWLLSVANELGETTSLVYDPNGNVAEIHDPEDNTTLRVFDERNLLYTQAAPNGDTVTLHYHPNATLAQVLDGNGNPTGYDTDAFDRLETTTHVDGTTEIRGYNPSSDLISWKTRAGDVFTFDYDDRHQLRSRITPADTATFAYDRSGRMTSAATSAASIAFAFNALDQLTSETATIPGLSSFVVGHEYDLEGNRTRITYPDSTYFTYEFDELDRLRFVRDSNGTALEERSYDELSRVTERIRSNDADDQISYDRASRIDSITFQGPSGIRDVLSYTRDPTGTIQALADNLGTYSYGYDLSKQLTSADYPVTSPFEDVSYLYDNAGNRDEEIASAVTDYAANALNQYSIVDSVAQIYDTNGNLTSDGTNNYTWDAEDRLSSALLSDGAGGSIAASYAYDPFMRRVSKTVDGITTYFLWSSDTLIGEYDATATRQRRYVYAEEFAPVLANDLHSSGGESNYFIHTDHLDTTRILTSADGEAVWMARLSAFGRATVNPDPDENGMSVSFHIGLPGQYRDDESGLHYNRYRYYDSAIGRYISADPLGQYDHENVYQYALLNPLSNIDPDGASVIRSMKEMFNRGKSFFVPGGRISQKQAVTIRERGGNVGVSGSDAERIISQIESAVSKRKGGKPLSHPAHGDSPVFRPHGQNSLSSNRGHSFNLNNLLAAMLFPAFALSADVANAYADYFLDAAAAGRQGPCRPQGGPPGGNDLHGQFLGTIGALNR